MKTDLVDRIYECSFRPDLWPNVLDDLAQIAAGQGGVLFAAREKVLNWTASATLHDTFRTYLTEGWLMRCTRRACLLTSKIPGFLVEQDIWSKDELDTNPIYRDFLRPRGLGWSAGTAMRMPTGDNLVVSIEREYGRGPIEPARIAELNELLPHIGRSVFIAARLKLERATSASNAVAALGLPAFVIDRMGRVQAANALSESLSSHFRWQEGSPLVLKDKAAQTLLDRGLAALVAKDAAAALSFPIRSEATAVLVGHLVPLRRSANDLFAANAAILVVTPVAPPGVPSVELLRSLFDLTPAEVRLARALAAGKTLREAAELLGVTHNTVRTQLRGVLEKVGCERQGDLVALIGNLSVDRNAHPG